eukprot:scaffold176029_cov22-Tisochrysis_lutea.AAC.1
MELLALDIRQIQKGCAGLASPSYEPGALSPENPSIHTFLQTVLMHPGIQNSTCMCPEHLLFCQ